jgi:hypothetical protein
LPDFRKDTKAIFHYEVFLPPKAPKIKEEESLEPEEAQKRIFPEDRQNKVNQPNYNHFHL